MPEIGHQANSCATSLWLQLHIKTVMPPRLHTALLCRKQYGPVATFIVELKTVITLYLQVPINNCGYYLIILLINMKDNVYFCLHAMIPC